MSRPKLYNPKLVCAAALLFTPLFGATLQARNWTELGRPDNAAASRMWIRASIWMIILYLAIQTIFRNEPLMQWLGPYFLIVLWGAWMITSGWQQLVEVNRTVGKNYDALPMGRPITLGVAGWLGYGLIATTITLGLVLAGIEPLETMSGASQESPGVVIRMPEGADKPIVEPLPPEMKEGASSDTNTSSAKP